MSTDLPVEIPCEAEEGKAKRTANNPPARRVSERSDKPVSHDPRPRIMMAHCRATNRHDYRKRRAWLARREAGLQRGDVASRPRGMAPRRDNGSAFAHGSRWAEGRELPAARR